MDLVEILSKTAEIAKTITGPMAAVVDREAIWPESTIRALQKAGLGGLVIPSSKGGLGHGLLALAQVCEILGRECSSSAICFGMHCVGTAVIAAKATESQRERYLKAICQGNHITTLALSERGSGSHFYYPQTQLRSNSNGDFVVNGSKDFVTNGNHADSYVISTVASEPNAPLGEFSCAVLQAKSEGMEWGRAWNGFGMRGNSSLSLNLREVSLSRNDLLGKEGDQLWYVFEIIAPYFLMAMAGSYLGIASTALDEVRLHIQKRLYSHSGTSLGQQPVIQHRLGSIWAKIERSRTLIYQAASQSDEGGDPSRLAAIFSAKAEMADCVVETVNEAMTLMGGIAYAENSKMGRLLRDARASQVMAPTTDLLRIWAGRALLGQPLLGDPL